MTARIIPVDKFDLVVFGGTGDLALRKLLPGLYYRDRDRQLPADSRIIGPARRRIDRGAYVHEVEAALRRYLPAHDIDHDCLERLLARLDYVALDATGVMAGPSSPQSSPARKTVPGSSTWPPRPTCSRRSAAVLRRRSW
jgi:glucose-6-phosphate 1-dehydrogenase